MGNTLLQRTTDLSGDLTRVRGLQLTVDEGALVGQRVQDLRTNKERLESPIAFLEGVRNHPELRRQGTYELDMSTALAAVERARAMAQNDPDAIVKGSALASVLAAVRQATQAAETAAASVWRQVVETMAPTVRTEVLAVLWQIPSYRDAVERLRELDRGIRELAISRWVSPDQVDTFLDLRRQAQQQWERLGGTETLPASVLDFLVACAREGATLDSMTPEIAEWIERRNLRGAFRIRFSEG